MNQLENALFKLYLNFLESEIFLHHISGNKNNIMLNYKYFERQVENIEYNIGENVSILKTKQYPDRIYLQIKIKNKIESSCNLLTDFDVNLNLFQGNCYNKSENIDLKINSSYTIKSQTLFSLILHENTIINAELIKS